MVKEIRIFCEGGGDSSSTKAILRKGMSQFLGEMVKLARRKRLRWHLTLCGSRQSAYDDFVISLKTYPHAFNLLLVDSESKVTKKPWAHLKDTDRWDSSQTNDNHCHLMVQTMEAWLIADLEALKKFYGQSFNESAIPRTTEVEQIPKSDLEPALKNASRHTSKGPYHKIYHAAKLLELLDTGKVRQVAPHCERLFRTLENLLT